MMRLGLAANAVSVALFAFVQQPWQALVPTLGCLVSFAVFPTANALAAAAVPRAQGGTAQGVVSGSRTLAEGLAPLLFGWLFQAAATSSWPGSPFLAAAGCVAAAFVASLRLRDTPVALGAMGLDLRLRAR